MVVVFSTSTSAILPVISRSIIVLQHSRMHAIVAAYAHLIDHLCAGAIPQCHRLSPAAVVEVAELNCQLPSSVGALQNALNLHHAGG